MVHSVVRGFITSSPPFVGTVTYANSHMNLQTMPLNNSSAVAEAYVGFPVFGISWTDMRL